MRGLLAAAVLALGGPGHSLAAQWYVGVDLATTRYGGSSHDTSASHVTSVGRPSDALMVSVVIGRVSPRVGFALRASYADPGLTLSGNEIVVTDDDVGPLLEVASMVNLRVAGIGPSGAVRAELGPALHLWDYGGEIRARVGAAGAAAYEWPVAGRFSGSIRLEGTLSQSWFDAADLPPEFERRLTWRYGVALGLRYML